MHALEIGFQLEVSKPRNLFNLLYGDEPKLLIAGGIGATPIVPMARRLKAIGASFTVVYLVKSKMYAALDSYFRKLNLGENYILQVNYLY